MHPSRPKYTTTDEYIAGYPTEVQATLQQIRQTIKDLLPKEAKEVISYGIPAFDLNGKHVVFFAAYEKHVSIHPFPYDAPEFKKEQDSYKTSKGTIQFPLDKPIPFPIIKKITKFKLKENLAKAKSTKKY